MRKTLLFDNYDSFTYNLHHLLRELGARVEVRRNDQISLDEVDGYDQIVLSPGPGIPEEAGLLLPLIRRFAPTKRILGVCLGEQAIGEAFGAKLINLKEVYHGVSSRIQVVSKDEILFKGLPESFEGGRYHSWVVDEKDFPECLEITARDAEKGLIMAIRHRQYDVRGIQFHPESVLTPNGRNMIQNWLHEKKD